MRCSAICSKSLRKASRRLPKGKKEKEERKGRERINKDDDMIN